MSRSRHGGRHELGQNFLTHRPTLDLIVTLVRSTTGDILELGAGDGALTRALAEPGRRLTAIELDEHRARRLARSLPAVEVVAADALRHPLDASVVVGNIPFHLTTPVLRRLLAAPRWREAVLVTQWEVARKRAGVGGGTLMTAQSAPWFAFALHGRVPSWGFDPRPGVDGGVLAISRRTSPLIAPAERRAYAAFVGAVFAGRGRGVAEIVRRITGADAASVRRALDDAGIPAAALPRDVSPEQWADLWGIARRSQRRP